MAKAKEQFNDIKVYQIDTGQFELRGYANNFEFIVKHMIDYHMKTFKPKAKWNRFENPWELGGTKYYLYVFSEEEKNSSWLEFFPASLASTDLLRIRSASFCLFIGIGDRLFAVIGRLGISVIARYMNPSFGLELYERFAKPSEDVVHTQVSRSVSGSLSSESKSYRKEQRLEDVLSIGAIPKSFYLELRDELRDTFFDYIDFKKTKKVYVEIGKAFGLRYRIDFDGLHDMITTIDSALDKEVAKPISRFERINDHTILEKDIKPQLMEKLWNDAARFYTGSRYSSEFLDYDFVHPQKLFDFYEAGEYQIFLYGATEPYFITRTRAEIYPTVLRKVYEDSGFNKFKFRTTILGIRVKGLVGDKEVCKAPFYSHISCEMIFEGSTIFHIDAQWYRIRGNFIEDINSECKSRLDRARCPENLLFIPWNRATHTEGAYNMLYNDKPGYYVLDTLLADNIEMCDIIYSTEKYTYLIHVKEGFDGKMRDLTNQINIAAQRLWNDTKRKYSFVKSAYDQYNLSGRNCTGIQWKEFKALFTKRVVFVMAFTSGMKGKSVYDNFKLHKSNIAKLSVIQNFRDMSDIYDLEVIEILKDEREQEI